MTNLNDSGAGSFRDAVSQPNRFIVFDVSGVVTLASTVSVQDNLTIAGQTAPGGGITLYGAKVSFTGADNTITRYLRVRKGTKTGRDDALSLADGSNMIFDHVSVTWGNDETFSLNPSSGATIDKITIQNSIVGQGLDNVNHSAGGLMQPNGSLSVLRSLFIDNETRNPKVKGTNQFVNNVVYNWTTAAYILGGDSDGDSYANVEGNYMIQGPAAGGSPFSGGNANFRLYANNNYYDSNRNGVLDGSVLSQGAYGPVTWQASPFDYPDVQVDSPQAAYQRVVNQVGPSLYRDQVDARMVQELSSLGTLGQIVVRETDLYPGYPLSLPAGTKPTDSDNDGIPDAWEASHGLNANDATDWKTIGPSGYTRLEEYFNDTEALSGNPALHADKTWTASSGPWTAAANWAGGAPTWDNDAFVRGSGAGTNGSVTLSGTAASAFRVFIGGNGDPSGERLTVHSGGSLFVMDTITVGDQNHGALEINAGGTVEATNVFLGNVAGGNTYAGTLTLNNGTLKANRIVVTGNGQFNWNGGTLQIASGTALFAVPTTLGAAGGALDSNGYSGTFSGAISGTGTLTKRGAGAIDLTGNNSFSGGVVLEAGSLGISSDSNVGGANAPITFNGGLLRINGTSLANLGSHPVNFSTFRGGFDISSSGHTFTVSQAIGGTGSVTKAGPGTLVLSGNNTYTGGTILQGGTLRVSADANLGPNGTTLTFSGGTLRIDGTTMTNLDNHPLAGGTLGGGINVATAGHVFAINQVINGGGSFAKSGPGTLLLTAFNQYNGDVVLNGGVVKLGHPNALRYATVNFGTAGASVDFGDGVTAVTIGGVAGSQPFDLKGMDVSVGQGAVDKTYSGALQDSVGGAKFTKVGGAIQTLTGTSTFAGPITIKAGSIAISSIGNAGVTGPLGPGSSADALVLDGGRLRYTGSGHSTNRLFTLAAGGGNIEGSGSGGFKLTSTGAISVPGSGNRTLTLSGSSTDNNFALALGDPVGGGKTSLNVSGSGRWIINSAAPRTYSGDTTISSGTLLALSNADVLPFGPGKGNLVINGGQFEMNSNNLNINALSGTGGSINNRTNGRTLTLGNGDASGSYSGAITNVPLSGTSTLNLVKVGTGKQVLSGANTYAGTTTVNGGVLQFNSTGSFAGGTTANVTVNAAGTVAAGYAINQSFLNRIAPASTGTVALAVDSANNLNLAAPGLSNVTLGAVGTVIYSGILTAGGSNYRLGSAGATLALAANGALSGSAGLVVTPGATLAIGGTNTIGGPTNLGAGAQVRIGATLTTAGLTLADGATFDLRDAELRVAYSPGNSPAAAIGAYLAAAYNAGRWNVGGLTSSFAAGDTTRATSVGYADDGSVVSVRQTWYGDANLDGVVDANDVQRTVAALGTVGGGWDDGDFNYDGRVSADDVALLNLGMSLQTHVMSAAVPEAGTAAALAGGVLVSVPRRRRLS